MNEKRASSDLLLNSSLLKGVVKVECITVEDDEIREHSLDVSKGTVESDHQEQADPVLSAVVSMLHNP